jgi:hypothetical protein
VLHIDQPDYQHNVSKMHNLCHFLDYRFSIWCWNRNSKSRYPQASHLSVAFSQCPVLLYKHTWQDSGKNYKNGDETTSCWILEILCRNTFSSQTHTEQLRSYFYRHKFIHQMIFVPHLHPTDLAFINNYLIKNRYAMRTCICACQKSQWKLRLIYVVDTNIGWHFAGYLVVEK